MKKKVLFATHEDIDKTAVARSMFLDVASSLRQEYDCTVLSASAEEKLRSSEEVNYMHFRRNNTGVFSINDIWLMAKFIYRHRKKISKFDIFYVRSYPAMIFFSIFGKILNIPTIFDTRGLFFHELIDSGKIKHPIVLKILIRIEKLLLKYSSAILCVSEGQMKYYLSMEPNKEKYHIIYNAAPTPLSPPSRTPNSELTIAYLGSMGKWHLPEKINLIVDELRKQEPSLVFHCITPDIEVAKSVFTDHPNTLIYSHAFRYDPKRFDFAFCLIKSSFSKKVCFPVKLSEYLASNTPVVFSDNVDVCNLLNERYEFGFPINVGKPPSEIAREIIQNLQTIKNKKVILPEELKFETLVSKAASVIRSV